VLPVGFVHGYCVLTKTHPLFPFTTSTRPLAPNQSRLITGGATGIGFGCAEAFGKHGAKVAIMGRRQDALDAAVTRLKAFQIDAFGVRGDVRKFDLCQAAVDAVVGKYGRLDYLVNNAAGTCTTARS
jgi:NAD(P)-dependent dehydrogenase (short-subunit alcohol dehydrogenase family)